MRRRISLQLRPVHFGRRPVGFGRPPAYFGPDPVYFGSRGERPRKYHRPRPGHPVFALGPPARAGSARVLFRAGAVRLGRGGGPLCVCAVQRALRAAGGAAAALAWADSHAGGAGRGGGGHRDDRAAGVCPSLHRLQPPRPHPLRRCRRRDRRPFPVLPGGMGFGRHPRALWVRKVPLAPYGPPFRVFASCCGLLTTVFGFASDRAAASHRRPPTASDCVWSNGGSSLGRFCRKGNPPGLGVADGAQTLEFRLVCAPEYVPFQNLLELHVSVRETAWLEAGSSSPPTSSREDDRSWCSACSSHRTMPVVALRRTRSCFSAFLMWFCSGGNL
mmetsp:Transcript_7153/g.23514  ORF Transcript_7153/g.23514 Transcript_7153/m.23514 type:complete len:331 (-) Transcript_7153:136-1128(-)